ncbi:DUF1704 domain-containing protein [Candidatus Saccharibacteria bacterium]|nr:DUF1704 domain-containing protein [Candidatus Saccharibacteria bacterium]
MFTVKDLQRSASKYQLIYLNLSYRISALNPVEMLTPTNLASAKTAWLEKAECGLFTNPSFHYNQALLSAAASQSDALESLKYTIDDTPAVSESDAFLLRHYRRIAEDALLTTRMAKAMLAGDDVALAQYVLAKYGRPEETERAFSLIYRPTDESSSDEETEKAEEAEAKDSLSAELKELKKPQLNAEFIKKIFLWAMTQYGVRPWPVEILKNCSAIDVRDKNSSRYPMIAIPASRKVGALKLAELVGHEIECHWRNSQNLSLINCLKSDDELVYEGLAKDKDLAFQSKYATDSTLAPFYVLAQNMALQGRGFVGIASFVYENTASPKKAWTVAYRTLRGLTNTINLHGYAFTKDRAYFEGLLYVQRLRDSGRDIYLNFGALSPRDLEDLSASLDRKSVLESEMLSDLDIQSKTLEKIAQEL